MLQHQKARRIIINIYTNRIKLEELQKGQKKLNLYQNELLMETKGIRISDGDKVLEPTLSDILEVITDGDVFYWSILFLDGAPNPDQGCFLAEYERKINNSENGVLIKWEEVITLSSKFFQMFETLILGCKDPKLLRRYKKEEEMYKACDIVIDLVDCVCWEVFSKDKELINRLASKFKEIEFLEPDFKR